MLTLVAVIVLVGYNAVHSPKALMTSLVAIALVAIFVVLYYYVKKENKLSLYMDKNLEFDENKALNETRKY